MYYRFRKKTKPNKRPKIAKAEPLHLQSIVQVPQQLTSTILRSQQQQILHSHPVGLEHGRVATAAQNQPSEGQLLVGSVPNPQSHHDLYQYEQNPSPPTQRTLYYPNVASPPLLPQPNPQLPTTGKSGPPLFQTLHQHQAQAHLRQLQPYQPALQHQYAHQQQQQQQQQQQHHVESTQPLFDPRLKLKLQTDNLFDESTLRGNLTRTHQQQVQQFSQNTRQQLQNPPHVGSTPIQQPTILHSTTTVVRSGLYVNPNQTNVTMINGVATDPSSSMEASSITPDHIRLQNMQSQDLTALSKVVEGSLQRQFENAVKSFQRGTSPNSTSTQLTNLTTLAEDDDADEQSSHNPTSNTSSLLNSSSSSPDIQFDPLKMTTQSINTSPMVAPSHLLLNNIISPHPALLTESADLSGFNPLVSRPMGDTTPFAACSRSASTGKNPSTIFIFNRDASDQVTDDSQSERMDKMDNNGDIAQTPFNPPLSAIISRYSSDNSSSMQDQYSSECTPTPPPPLPQQQQQEQQHQQPLRLTSVSSTLDLQTPAPPPLQPANILAIATHPIDTSEMLDTPKNDDMVRKERKTKNLSQSILIKGAAPPILSQRQPRKKAVSEPLSP